MQKFLVITPLRLRVEAGRTISEDLLTLRDILDLQLAKAIEVIGDQGFIEPLSEVAPSEPANIMIAIGGREMGPFDTADDALLAAVSIGRELEAEIEQLKAAALVSPPPPPGEVSEKTPELIPVSGSMTAGELHAVATAEGVQFETGANKAAVLAAILESREARAKEAAVAATDAG